MTANRSSGLTLISVSGTPSRPLEVRGVFVVGPSVASAAAIRSFVVVLPREPVTATNVTARQRPTWRRTGGPARARRTVQRTGFGIAPTMRGRSANPRTALTKRDERGGLDPPRSIDGKIQLGGGGSRLRPAAASRRCVAGHLAGAVVAQVRLPRAASRVGECHAHRRAFVVSDFLATIIADEHCLSSQDSSLRVLNRAGYLTAMVRR